MKIRKVAKNTNFNLKKYTSWAILKVYLVLINFCQAIVLDIYGGRFYIVFYWFILKLDTVL